MEPRIQYAKTEDGVSIAYYALGQGSGIVRMPNNIWSHFQLQWQAVPALVAIRESLAPDGVAIIADERVADSFTAPGDEAERLFYGISVVLCLPAGMADESSAATGTVMRASTMRTYALEAGFKDVEVLDLEHPMLRFYRLTQ